MENSTYYGRPCKRCGGTLRDSRDNACIICKNTRNKEKINTAEKVEGKPCRVCGGTLRYEKGGQCVACTKRKNAIKIEKRRAANALIPKRQRHDQRCSNCGETKNYFFLEYCRECVEKHKRQAPEKHTLNRCDNCGVYKSYAFIGHCKQCQYAEKRRRLYWETQDKIKENIERQRRYSDPF
ncbi:hypothetical protein FQJ65_01250 [Escherichia coli]|nr:hypothetical protein [Escherichia coli]